MHRVPRQLALLAVFTGSAAFTGALHAAEADSGLYAGVALGWVSAPDLSASGIDAALASGLPPSQTSGVTNGSTAWQVFAGYRFNRHFAFEMSYNYISDMGFTTYVPSLSAIGAGDWSGYDVDGVLVASLPIGERFAVFGKAGAAFYDVQLEAMPTTGSVTYKFVGEATGWSPALGVGASFTFAEGWAVRAEWDMLFNVGNSNTTGRSDLSRWLVGVMLAF